MAYTSGSASDAAGLVQAISTFATANGWTLHDNIASNDKVLTSTGTDGKVTMYFRIHSHDSSANVFYNTPYHPQRCMPGVLANAYLNWNATTHVGTNSYGQLGPFMHGTIHQNTVSTLWRYSFINPFMSANAQMSWPISGDSTGNMMSSHVNNGGRIIYGAPSTSTSVVGSFDLLTGTNLTTTAGGFATFAFYNLCCFTYNSATDSEEVYFLRNDTAASQFFKYNFTTSTATQLTSPAFTSPQGAFLLWDGADTIYSHQANAATTFKKYSISGNSWTSLTASPVAKLHGASNFSTPMTAVYIPSAVSGFSTDVIYTYLTSNTTIYRYDISGVNANTWTSVVSGTTGAFTSPVTFQQHDTYLLFDGISAILTGHHQSSTNMLMYGTKMGSALGTFSTIGQMGNVSTSNNGIQVINNYAARARCAAATSTSYWLTGDADSIVAVTKVGSRYHWMSFGRYTSLNSALIANTTSQTTAGTGVSVEVGSSTGFIAGQRVQIFDPSKGTISQAIASMTRAGSVVTVTSTAHGLSVGNQFLITPGEANFAAGMYTVATVPNANTFTYSSAGSATTNAAAQSIIPWPTEVAYIDSIIDGTHIKMTLRNDYAAGSKIGIDPAPYGCVSSEGFATVALGPYGYFMADQMTPWYLTKGVVTTSDASLNAVNSRNVYQMAPIKMYQSASAVSNREDVGIIKRVWLVGPTGLNSEDAISFDGVSYKVFAYSTNNVAANETRFFVISAT